MSDGERPSPQSRPWKDVRMNEELGIRNDGQETADHDFGFRISDLVLRYEKGVFDG